MRRGTVTVECDSQKCHAEVVYEAAALSDNELSDMLSDDGWERSRDGKDACPDCVRERNGQRERDDAYERAAARDRNDDFARTGGRDWT